MFTDSEPHGFLPAPKCWLSSTHLGLDRANLQEESHQCAEPRDQSACKYPQPKESTIHRSWYPPRATACPQHLPRSSAHRSLCRQTQEPQPTHKARKQPPAAEPRSQTPNNPPNPKQNISPQAESPAARWESAHPSHETSPPPKSKRSLRNGRPLVPDDFGPSRTLSRPPAEARPGLRRRAKTLRAHS